MARRYETYTSQCGWAMEPCEERLFIAFYEDVRGNIDPSIKWPDKFEIGFYQEGFGVLDMYRNSINKVRLRLDLPIFTIRETDVGEYARRDERAMKSARRHEWRNEYLSLNNDGKVNWRTESQQEVDSLPPPHASREEYVATFGPKNSEPVGLGPAERARRERALLAASQSDQPEPPPTRSAPTPLITPVSLPGLTMRLLRLAARSPDALARLAGKISLEQAIEAAEKVEDEVARNALVMHAIDSMNSANL